MKKKILCLISFVFILLPCLLLLSACGASNETGFIVRINDNEILSSELEIFYGEEIDLEVASLFDDGSSKNLEESSFELTDSGNIVGTKPSVGRYDLSVKYGDYDTVNFTLIVKSKPVSMPTIGASIEYTGSEQKCPLIGFDEEIMNIEDNTATIVGNYTTIVSLKDTNNYIWKGNDNNFELYYNWGIVKKRLAKPVTGLALEYNTAEQNFSINGFDENTMAISGQTSGVVVDEYLVKVSLKDTENYCWIDKSIEDVSVCWNIEKCKLAKPEATQKTYTYSAEEQTFEMTGFDDKTMTAFGNKQTNAGDLYKVEIVLKDKLNYCWSDETDANIEFSWTIEKCKLAKPEATQKTYTYSTEEQSFEMIGFDDRTMTIFGNKQTNARNSYKVEVGLKDKSNYCWSDETDANIEFSWTIEKCRLEKPEAFPKTYTYSTEEQTFEMTGFDDKTMTAFGNKQTNARNSYKVEVGLKDKSNYCWSDETDANIEFSWTIEKAQAIAPKVSLYGVYSPNQTLKEFNLPKNFVWVDENIIPTVLETQYLAKYNPDSSNYFDAQTQITLNLDKCKLEKPQAIQNTYTYSAEEQTFEMTGFDEKTMTILGNKQTNAGEHKVDVSIADKDNYCWSDETDNDVEFVWVIEKIRLAMPQAIQKTYTYSAEEQTFEMTGFDEKTMVIVGNKQINAGEHTVVISVKDEINYSWDNDSSSFSLTWIILKQSVEMLAKDEYKFVWTGKDIEFIPKDFDNQIFNIENNIQSELGVYDAVILIKDMVNYEWSDKTTGGKTLSFEIVKATPEITFKEENIDKVYDGKIINVPRLVYSSLYLSEWGEDATFSDIADDITLSYEIRDNGEYKTIESNDENFAKAGYYRVTMVMPHTSHFNSVTLTKEFKIYNFVNPEDYSVLLSEYDFCYDGTAKEPEVEVRENVNVETDPIDSSLYTVTYSNNIQISHEALVIVTFNDELMFGQLCQIFTISPQDLISTVFFDGQEGYYIDNSTDAETVEFEIVIKEKYLTQEGDKSYFDGELFVCSYEYDFNHKVEMNAEGRFICQVPINIDSITIEYQYKGYNTSISSSITQKVKNSNYVSALKITDESLVDSISWNMSHTQLIIYDARILDNLDAIEVVFNDDYVLVRKYLNEERTKLIVETKRRYYAGTTTLRFDIQYYSYGNEYCDVKEAYVSHFDGKETIYKFENKKITIDSLSSAEMLVFKVPGFGGDSTWTFSKGTTKIVDNQEMFNDLRLPISSEGTYELIISGDYMGTGTYTFVIKQYVEAFAVEVNGGCYQLLADRNYSNKYGDFYLHKDLYDNDNFFYTFVGAIDDAKTSALLSITSIHNCFNSKMEKLTDLSNAMLDIMTDESGQRYVDLIIEIEEKYTLRIYFIKQHLSGADLAFVIGDKVLSFDRDEFYGDENSNTKCGDFTYIGFNQEKARNEFVVKVSASELGEICDKDNNIAGNVFVFNGQSLQISPSWSIWYEGGKTCGDFVLESMPNGFKQIVIESNMMDALIIEITND